jgi:type IV pilus assembly protein PilQ
MMVRALCVLLCCVVFASPGTLAARDTGAIAGTAARDIDVDGINKRFFIAFQNADMKAVLRFLADIAKVNLITPEDVKGLVNVTLEDITVIDAINAIAKANELEYAVERGIIRIGHREDFTASGEDLKTKTFRLSYAVATTMSDKVKKLLTDRGSVLADERTNSLVIRETVANLEQVERFIENVDVRDAQVLIEARLVEATRDWARNLGIQWGWNMAGNTANATGLSVVGTSDAGRTLNVNLPAATPTSGVGLLIGTVLKGSNIDVQISAAETKGDLHVISEPSIVTSNGVPAHIRSGETIFVKTAGSVSIGGSSASGGGDSGLEEIATGVELNVTPHISVGDFVKMEIDTITSAADFTRTVDGIPAIVDNTAKTTVLVRDGETTVIGGLIRLRGQDSRSKVPFLGDLPLLGYLFQSRQRNKTNNELMIFIRPTIVRDRIVSPLQNRIPHIRNVRKDLLVDDEDHLPREARRQKRRGQRAQRNRMRTRYEHYRTSHGQ